MGDTQPRRLEQHVVREIVLIGALVLLALVQSILLPLPFGFPPALLLVLIVCMILVGFGSPSPENDVGIAVRWAFYGGLALDLLSYTPLGSHALALLLAALMVMLLVSQVPTGGALMPLVCVLLGATVYEVTLAVVYQFTVMSFDWQRYLLAVMLPSVIFALIPTLPVFHLLRWWRKRW
jgi:rod shape-determining protein MreD